MGSPKIQGFDLVRAVLFSIFTKIIETIPTMKLLSFDLLVFNIHFFS